MPPDNVDAARQVQGVFQPVGDDFLTVVAHPCHISFRCRARPEVDYDAEPAPCP